MNLSKLEYDRIKNRSTRKISIAVCFPLSWKLLIYARETLFVASDKTPEKMNVLNTQHWIHERENIVFTSKCPLPASCDTGVQGACPSVYP